MTLSCLPTLFFVIYPLTASADYVKVLQYETSSTCDGPVYSSLAKLGDLGVADGCLSVGPSVYSKYFCNNSSSLISNKYFSPTCSGTPFESTSVMNISFGCSILSASSSINYSCEKGTFSVSSFSFVKRTYASAIPCIAVESAPPLSIIEAPLDTCISYASNGLKYSFDVGSGNIFQTLFSTPGCVIGSSGSPSVIGSAGCQTTSSETLVTLCTSAVSPSSTPTPSTTPSPSATPSALPLIQQTFQKQISYYGDTTCSSTPYPSYVITNYQTCLSSISAGKSFLRVCSSDGKSEVQYTYANLECSGQPVSSINHSLGCVATSTGGSYQFTCQTGDFVPPSNSLVIQSFTNSRSCSSNLRRVFTQMGNVEYTVYPVDTCLTTTSGSSLTSCSSTAASISQFNTNNACNGSPDVVTTAPVGVCNISAVNVADSFIALCPGLPSPSPFTTASPTPSPSLSIGASPSSTSTFKASPTPVNPRLSRYTLATNGGMVAYRARENVDDEDECIIDAKYAPIMSILIFNPLNGLVTIKQKGMTKGYNVFDISLTTGVNAIQSTSTWVSLGNISCVSSENPTGYCFLYFKGTQNLTVWTSYYKLSSEVVSASNAQGNGATLGGGIFGGFILLLLILAVLHTLRVINVPCFNSCCDNRFRKRNLTMTPEVVNKNNYPIAVPVSLPQQPRAQVVAMMQPPNAYPMTQQGMPQQQQLYPVFPSTPSPQRATGASRV